MERLKPSIRARRILWGVVIFLALIGVFVVARRTARLLPILISANRPPTIPVRSTQLAQFSALDDMFARYPVLTLSSHPALAWSSSYWGHCSSASHSANVISNGIGVVAVFYSYVAW